MYIRLNHTLMLKIKFVYQRGATYYWQRKIPHDLADRYPAAGTLKTRLHAATPVTIAAEVGALNRQHEALWDAMRNDPTLTPKPVRDAARDLLKAHGLPANGRGAEEDALSLFYDTLDTKREAYAATHDDPEETHRDAFLSDFLTPTEEAAVKLLNGGKEFLLSDALPLYLKEHRKQDNPSFETYSRRVWDKFLSVMGDKPFIACNRDDAKQYRDNYLASGVKTATVRRAFNVLRAVFQSVIHDKGLTLLNPWTALTIPGLGLDSSKRQPFTPEELATLRQLCHTKDDDRRWILAMQADTGTRLAELVGLTLEDIHITGEAVPYVAIKPHTWRSLKNDNSTRSIPLVGDALWAARRVLSTATPGQRFAFPRYMTDGTCRAATASSTLNKWMKESGLPHTTHELRHTMRDRLRNSGAPRDIQDAIGGWGKATDGDNYGTGYAMARRQESLLKTLPEVD